MSLLGKIKESIKWIDKYFFTVITSFVSFLVIYGYLSKPIVKTENDYLEITGTLSDYSFVEKQGNKSILYQYYIWLNEYPATFQIKANYLQNFKKLQFISIVNKGQRFSFNIPIEEKNNLFNSEKKIFLLSIVSKNDEFLNLNSSMERENNPSVLYFGIVFFLLGITYYIWKRYKTAE